MAITNVFNIISQYLVGGNPDTLNVVGVNPVTNPGEFRPNMPGQVGGSFHYQNKEYCLAKLDPGATALLVGQVLYWKDRNNKEVTNVVANAVNGGTADAWRNEVAGIARVAIATPDATNGNYICILTKGSGITVLATSGAIGSRVMSDVSGGVGKVLTNAVGTAPGYQEIGVVTTAVSAGVVVMDVNLPTPC